MALQKVRSFQDAERALRRRPLDPENLRIMATLSRTAFRLAGMRRRVGIFRYRTIEEADAARAAEKSELVREVQEHKKPMRDE